MPKIKYKIDCPVCLQKNIPVTMKDKIFFHCMEFNGDHCPICPTSRQSVSDYLYIKNPHAVASGRLGGLKGGKARAAKLSPQRRTEIAREAAKARWNKV